MRPVPIAMSATSLMFIYSMYIVYAYVIILIQVII